MRDKHDTIHGPFGADPIKFFHCRSVCDSYEGGKQYGILFRLSNRRCLLLTDLFDDKNRD